jgi:hypothetical protein
MRRRTLGFVLLLCALPLTESCVSPEELRNEDEAACAGYGFHVGTDAFATCLQRESLARRYLPLPPTRYWGWGYWGWP